MITINGQKIELKTDETVLVMLPDGWACKFVKIGHRPKFRLRSPGWYVRLIKERRGQQRIRWGTDWI